MSHRHLAATPWEVEAERRREVLDRAVSRTQERARDAGSVHFGQRVRDWLAGRAVERVPGMSKLFQRGV